jgi:hypothetical protein
MVSNIPVGLAQLLGDFFERIAFEEMQSKCFPLVFGQRLQNPPPAISPEETFDSLVVVRALIAGMITFNWFVCDAGQIEPVRLKSSSPHEGLCVGYLDDPRTRRPF